MKFLIDLTGYLIMKVHKGLFCFQKKRIRKTLSTCQKKTTKIKVFLDFWNIVFLLFLTLELCTNIKSLISKSQF